MVRNFEGMSGLTCTLVDRCSDQVRCQVRNFETDILSILYINV